MERKNYRGARKVYGWSFYSQGAEQGKQASADEFMQETLTWFGDKNPGEGHAVEKGRRLARLVREQPTLLVLDGMEPLQYPPGEVHGYDGRLKDRGLETFLKELSGGHPGLCVITSREPVTGLAHKKGFTLKEMELEHLSPGAGVQLLKGLGVRGTDKEVKTAVEEYKGHALALTLLGRYIKSSYEGDIRKRDRVPRLSEERLGGGHAVRVMDAYVRWLGESPGLDVLRIMGLFDRPVEKGAVDALIAGPVVPGVTDKLQRLTEEGWQMALDNLRGAGLLAENDRQKPGVLDCHPLVREHFGHKLKRENPGGWKEAHKRLYNYYKDLPGKELPDTLAEMGPLFAAVAHGCRAGLHQEALDDVYWKRILREDESYIVKKLGAFGSFLAVLSHFFEKPWTLPAPGLTDHVKAVVLSWSAFGLRAQGRLHEAIQPMKASIKMEIQRENWLGAAQVTNNLSALMLTLGKVAEAVSYGRESVTHADRGGDDFEKESDRTALADALHQAGHLNEAEQLFREAEAMQKKRQPEYTFLYSLRGYRYCDLLLGQGTYHDVMARAEKTLEWSSEEGFILDISLDTLSLGRAWLLKTVREEGRDFTRAREYLNRAVTGLREYGSYQHLPRGLFVRAECFRLMKQFSRAWDDLKEAEEIAEMGGMKLFLCDYHLEAARLCAAEGKDKEADQHFRKARELIEETGYLRRKNEVEKK
jgi:tetratricopeptide (TPR) repeat protein